MLVQAFGRRPEGSRVEVGASVRFNLTALRAVGAGLELMVSGSPRGPALVLCPQVSSAQWGSRCNCLDFGTGGQVLVLDITVGLVTWVCHCHVCGPQLGGESSPACLPPRCR